MASDEALHEALLRGDLRAFDALYERHSRALFGFIRRHLPEPSEAEDVLHEAFLALLRDGAQARRAASLKAWLFGVARNLCLNRLRSSRRAAHAVERARDSVPPASPAPDLALEHAQDARALRAALARLPVDLAELYQLRASGLSYEEIAGVLAIPLGTVKSRMHQMVRRLREEMST